MEARDLLRIVQFPGQFRSLAVHCMLCTYPKNYQSIGDNDCAFLLAVAGAKKRKVDRLIESVLAIAACFIC